MRKDLKEIASQYAKSKILNDFIVEVKNGVFVTLKELMPYDWKEDLDREW